MTKREYRNFDNTRTHDLLPEIEAFFAACEDKPPSAMILKDIVHDPFGKPGSRIAAVFQASAGERFVNVSGLDFLDCVLTLEFDRQQVALAKEVCHGSAGHVDRVRRDVIQDVNKRFLEL